MPTAKKGIVDIPNGIEKIISGAFDFCECVEKISIPQTLIEILSSSYYLKNLKEIVVDSRNKVYSAKDGLLFKGTELELCLPQKSGTVDIPYGTTRIGSGIFYDRNTIKEIRIPSTVVDINKNKLSGIRSLERIEVNNSIYQSIDGVLYADGGTTLEYCPKGRKKLVSIPNEVKKIAPFAFADCVVLNEIQLPDSLEEISENAFVRCNKIKQICIPKSTTKISIDAFTGCESLYFVEENIQTPYYYCRNGALFEKFTENCLFKPTILKRERLSGCDEHRIAEAYLFGEIKDILFKYGIDASKKGVLSKRNIYYEIAKQPEGPYRELLEKIACSSEMKKEIEDMRKEKW